MRLMLETRDKSKAIMKLAKLKAVGKRGVIKTIEYHNHDKKYNVYQINKIPSHKPTKDNELRDDITSFLYGCFGTWKERSFYDLSKVNQDSWRAYGDDIMQRIEKAGYRKERAND